MMTHSFFRSILSATALLAIPAIAHAHGTLIQFQIDNNKIISKGIVADGSYGAATSPTRLYNLTMGARALGDAGDGWYIQLDSNANLGPGVGYGSSTFLPNNTLSITFTSGLQYWNGTSFIDAGDTQLQGVTGSNLVSPASTALFQSTDTGPFQSKNITYTTVTANSHNQTYWRLLGNGLSPNTSSLDGYYLASFQLSTTQPGIAPSDTYYFLLNKNAPTNASAPTAYLNTNIIPEPTALGLLIPAAPLLLRRRK